MPQMTTTNGITFNSDLTDAQAYQICQRMSETHPNYGFVRSLIRQYNRGLTPNQRPYLHLWATRILEDEGVTLAEATQERAITRQSDDETRQFDPPAPTTGEPSFNVERNLEHASSLNLCMFQYDIPVGPDGPIFPNPSANLRRYAIRTTLSVWVVPESRIPYTLINAMREAGCTCHVVKFDMGDVEKLIALVEFNLKNEVTEAMKRLEESCGRAGELHGTEVKMDRHIDNAAKRVNTLLTDLESAAKVFGLNLSDLLKSNRGKIQLIQTNAYHRAREYAKAARAALETRHSDAEAVGRAALNDDGVHPGILSDALRDAGREDEADALTEAFRPE